MPPFAMETSLLQLCRYFAYSISAYCVAAGSPFPAIIVVSVYIILKRQLVLRTLSKFELLPSDIPSTEGRVDAWLRARDHEDGPLQPGAESTVTWAGRSGVPTELCVVSLHGWGASPPELSPVPERIATALGANLLRFRYTAHGLAPEERAGVALLTEQSATVLRSNAATAFHLGQLLGKRVVLLGGSTGGSLSLWLARQPWAADALAALQK